MARTPRQFWFAGVYALALLQIVGSHQLEAGRRTDGTSFVHTRGLRSEAQGTVLEESFNDGSSSRREKGEEGYTFTDQGGRVLTNGDVQVVLKDDEIVEVRRLGPNARTLKIVKASGLPDSELNSFDLEYTLMELDKLSILVSKHDEGAKEYRVKLDGSLDFPLIGNLKIKGLTEAALEQLIEDKMTPFVREPKASVEVVKKSPRSRILLIGKGFREYEGHERILDVLGSGWIPSHENIYDKVCVIREYPGGVRKCIIVDMEYMFKHYDFTQNISLKAGDIIHIRKMPPLLGYRLRFWWTQVLDWLNELDEGFNAYDSVRNFDFNTK